MTTTEKESRQKSALEDQITKATINLKQLNDETIKTKAEIGRLAYEYKAICEHGEYDPLMERLGISKDSIIRWRNAVCTGETPGNGKIFKRPTIRLQNATTQTPPDSGTKNRE
jgi:hypothetical protein